MSRQESCTFKFEMDDMDCYASYYDPSSMTWASNVNDSLHEFYVSEYSIHDVTGMTQAQAESYLTIVSVTL